MRNKPFILQIGLIQYEPAWELLLRQIGISWKVILPEEELIQNYSVLIANGAISDSLKLKIDLFTAEGGVVLYTTSLLDADHSKVITKKYVKSLPPVRNSMYTISSILDLYQDCYFFANNDLIDIEQSGNGFTVYLGIPCDVVLSSHIQRKNFFTPAARMPNEIVAKRTKGSFRQLVFSLLVHLHHLQNIPFLHKWYYPNGAPTIFTFRIDSDKGSQDQIEEIYQLSKKYSIPTTWFLDVKSHESWIEYFKKFDVQEIAVHCYEHSISHDKETNYDNFLKAKNILEQSEINAVGFSAPTGMWNESLAQAIEDLGFHYSSEFGYDYDNLPSFPFHSGHFSHVTQLPVHPICIGSMLRAHLTDDEMISYFKKIIDANYALNEPICLYHHPTHKHNEVFEEIFNYIQRKNIPALSYADYAAWWKKRDSCSTKWKFDDNAIIAVDRTLESGYTRIILPNGDESISELNGKTRIEQLEFKSPSLPMPVTDDVMRSRKFDARHILQNALDWWIKTTE